MSGDLITNRPRYRLCACAAEMLRAHPRMMRYVCMLVAEEARSLRGDHASVRAFRKAGMVL